MFDPPNFMLAYRAHDRRVIPSLAIYRRDCCRCGTPCALTPASASAADASTASRWASSPTCRPAWRRPNSSKNSPATPRACNRSHR